MTSENACCRRRDVCRFGLYGYATVVLGVAALAAVVRLCAMAQALLFLGWLIKTSKDNERVLRLILLILKALPGLLREDRRWATSLRQLVPRPSKASDEDSAGGAGSRRNCSPS